MIQNYKQLMINEITINSNNTIELSRGELLNWVNELLKTNLTKIQQLGTGAVYCQLMDVLYPNIIPLSKVNFKAKNQYEYVNNFKILQQSFTKLKAHRNIDVQKLIKCKYQDNLQFLQWFRKIFQKNGNINEDYNPIQRRGENDPEKKREKENRNTLHSTNSRQVLNRSNSRTHTDANDRSYITPCDSFIASQKADETDKSIPCSVVKLAKITANPPNSPDHNFRAIDVDWKADIKDQAFQEEREFYLKKFKQIEHLCEQWNQERSSGQLIDNIRKIILVAPNVDWSIEGGQYKEVLPTHTSIAALTEE